MSRDDLELVIFIGLQASGKTTFRQTRFDGTHVIVSKDLLRNNRRPQSRQMHLIEAALTANAPVGYVSQRSRLLYLLCPANKFFLSMHPQLCGMHPGERFL